MNSHPQAAFLRAVADHLEHHQLPGCLPHWHASGPVWLQLLDRNANRALVEWAASLNADTVTVKVFSRPDEMHVHIDGTIGGRTVDAWGVACVHADIPENGIVPVADLVCAHMADVAS
jgi:hypothetical protein